MTTKLKLSLIALGGVLLLGGGAYFYLGRKGEEAVYREVRVKRDDLSQYVQATGLVSPQNRLEIKPPVPGRIDEVLVKEGDVVKKGKNLAWISSNERAALMDSVRGQGAGAIKKWSDLYRPTPVIAPISGTIILKSVEAGQSFVSTDAIFVMADRLTVKAQVDETDIAQVKKGQRAHIILDAYPNDPVEGEVVHIAFDATVTNNVTTYLVDVLPKSVPEFMRSGMTSNVSIEIAHRPGVLTLPLTAVTTTDDGASVLVLNQGKRVLTPIETGISDGKRVEILKGPLEGETVLVKVEGPRKKKGSASNPLFPQGRRGGGGGGRR